MKVKLIKGTEEKQYIVVVTGDSTGDGKVKAQDLVVAVKQYKYSKTNGEKGASVEGAELKAIKYTENAKYTPSDLVGQVKIYKKYK